MFFIFCESIFELVVFLLCLGVCVLFCFWYVFFWRSFTFFFFFLSFFPLVPFLKQESKAVRVQKPGASGPLPPQPSSAEHPPSPCIALPQKQILKDAILWNPNGRQSERGRVTASGTQRTKRTKKEKPPSLEPREVFTAGIHGKHVCPSRDHMTSLARRLRVTWHRWFASQNVSI